MNQTHKEQGVVVGLNRTGTAMSSERARDVAEAADELGGVVVVNEAEELASYRVETAREFDGLIGSVPVPPSVKGAAKMMLSTLAGSQPAVLIDKLGERLAFERTGTRLYDALIVKYQTALAINEASALGASAPSSSFATASAAAGGTAAAAQSPRLSAEGLASLQQIRDEELEHAQLISSAMLQLGADPTAQTPCADAIALSSIGLLQTVAEPRTSVAQSLNAVLTAELTDNAGWELLIQLAQDAGQTELSEKFGRALLEEQNHLRVIKSMVTATVLNRDTITAMPTNTPAPSAVSAQSESLA